MVKKSKKGANKNRLREYEAEKIAAIKKRDYKRERVYTLLTNSRNDHELEEGINLFIKGESDITSEGGDDDNSVER
jgi:hypothetical protein